MLQCSLILETSKSGMMKKVIVGIFAILMVSIGISDSGVYAQGGNLLRNSDMEGQFFSKDGVTGVPDGWTYFQFYGAPDADRQEWAPHAFSDPTSWTFRARYTPWVAGGYQTVQVQPGVVYQAGAHVFIWTCNDPDYSCIPGDAPRFSNTESGSRARIGIDPNGGTDAQSGTIIWSPWVQSFDTYTGIRVDAQATTGLMTVFIQGDAGAEMAFNEIYWDDVTLIPIDTSSAGEVAAPDTAAAAPPASDVVVVPQFVPFVDAQQARPDGSVVHVVRAEDTFNSILVAYQDLGITTDYVLALNNLRFVPDFITIGQELLILPAGSVNPETGEVINPPTSAPAAPVDTAPPAQPADGSAQPAQEAPAAAPAQPATAALTGAQPTDPTTLSVVDPVTIPVIEAITPLRP